MNGLKFERYARATRLFRGSLEKSRRIFQLFSPSGQGYGLPFLASYRCISGTLRVQFGNNSGTDTLKQHARSAASCMVILEHPRRNRRFFPLFPYLLIYRTEEVEGSNPARSTKLPPLNGLFSII
jgi:hypothetical protein